MSDLLRVDLIIIGIVQGVGYRHFVKKKAESLGIKGYVRNKKDGSVFVAAQGDKNALNALIDWCYCGPPYSKVRNIEKFFKDNEDLENFRILF